VDARLRQLKRQAESDPQYWPHYARELERALAGETEFQPIKTEEFNLFDEETIAVADYLPDYNDDAQTVGGLDLHLEGSGWRPCAWYVNTSWQECFGDDESIAEIEANLSPGFVALLETAKQKGYQQVLLWTGR